jgi:hypothetical protein
VKKNKRLIKRITKEEVEIEKSIHHLRLDYFIIKVIKQLVRPPIVTMTLMLWNKKFNYATLGVSNAKA